MTQENIALWVQVAAVLAAVGAAIVALRISAADRAQNRQLAAQDRNLARLMFDLELLLRLLENFNKGGSQDSQESDRMGAEALTLVGALGPDRLPHAFEEKVGSDAGLRELLNDDEMPDYKKEAIRVQLAVNEVAREIRALI